MLLEYNDTLSKSFSAIFKAFIFEVSNVEIDFVSEEKIFKSLIEKNIKTGMISASTNQIYLCALRNPDVILSSFRFD